MSDINVSTAAMHSSALRGTGTSVAARVWRAALWAIPSLPLVVLVHEAGHFGAFLAFGFPDPVLHSASATFDGADRFWELMRLGQRDQAAVLLSPVLVGLATLTGLAMSIFTIIGAVVLVRRAQHPLALAAGLLAPLRFLVGVPAVTAWLRGQSVTPGSDEGQLALLLGVHPGPLALGGLLVMAAAWWGVLSPVLRSGQGRWILVGSLVGAAAGGVLYVGWLGPLLLP